jgi:hypothetical protein
MIIYYATIEVKMIVITDEVRWNVDNPDRRTRRGKKSGYLTPICPEAGKYGRYVTAALQASMMTPAHHRSLECLPWMA